MQFRRRAGREQSANRREGCNTPLVPVRVRLNTMPFYVFVNCGNPDCFHNAELDVSRFPDDLTYNDLQPRLLCTVCDHRGADVGPSWLRHG